MLSDGARRQNRTGLLTALLTLVVAGALIWTLLAGSSGRVQDGRFFLNNVLSIPVVAHMAPLTADRGHIEVWEGRSTLIRPAFDVPGLEQPLSPRPPFWDPHTWLGSEEVVYLGEVAFQTAYVHRSQPPSLWAKIKSFFGGDLPPSGMCFTSGFGISACDAEASGAVSSFNVISGSRWFAWWIGVPPETAVVTAEAQPATPRWQRPVAETVVFAIEDVAGIPGDGITLTAYDASGNQLERRSVLPFEADQEGP